MLVVDASVLVPALVDRDGDGERARALLRSDRLWLPDLAYLEVISVLRRLTRAGSLDPQRGREAVQDIGRMPVSVVPHHAVLERVWVLRDSVSPYDAAYVAVAELAGATLFTADARLARAHGPECPIVLVVGD